MRYAVIVACLLLGLVSPGSTTGVSAESGGLTRADEEAIHSAVQTQLDALADDDAEAAFRLASLDTQTRFGSPDNFLLMVKKHYTPIYRHQLALFSRPEIIEGEAIQIVRLTDRDSHVWLAVYKMESASDGSWKIDGCKLLETSSVAI